MVLRMLALATLLVGCRRGMVPDVPVDPEAPAAWAELLSEVVTEDGLVDYDRLEQDRAVLDAYVAWLGREPAHGTPNATRHAFWLNAYNALVLYAVLENGRPDSVMDVDGWLPFSGSGFFYEQAFLVDGEWVSLWDIEHERLRMRLLDYRDHAALNCASRSCPPLRNQLYTPVDLQWQLKDQMTRWIEDPERGVRVEDGGAEFSALFQWYARDFEFWSGGDDLCTIAARFAKGEQKAQLEKLAARGCPRRFKDYDWSLNDASER